MTIRDKEKKYANAAHAIPIEERQTDSSAKSS